MGIIDFFKTKSRSEWTAGPAVPLLLDLDQNALSGAALRDSDRLLWRFGEPEDGQLGEAGQLAYFSRGFAADAAHGRIESWLVFWQDREQRYAPFKGRVQWRQREIPLAAGLKEADVVTLLGEPFWRDEDDAEVILFYEHHAAEWQVEIGRHDGLSAIILTAMPLLADAEQRRAYGVTRHWPPEGV